MVLLIAEYIAEAHVWKRLFNVFNFYIPKMNWRSPPFLRSVAKTQEYWNGGYSVDPPRGSAPFYRTQLAKRNDSVIIFEG